MHTCSQVCLLPVAAFQKWVCAETGGRDGEQTQKAHRFKNSSLNGPKSFVSVPTSGATLSVILSAPVPDASQSSGVSQTQAPIGPVGHFCQAEAKAAVQIKPLRDRPITIQQHTHSVRKRRGDGNRPPLCFQAPLSCRLKEPRCF